jgi:5-dehydro-2-deoxygluconokinase
LSELSTLDVLTVGRVCVDLYANERNASWLDPQTFTKSIGGTATNVAVAAARLGHRAAVYTKVGNDPFGEYVRAKLTGFGVDTRYIGTHPELPTPLAFAAMDPPEDPKIIMCRYPQGPDMILDADDVSLDDVVNTSILWLTGAWFSAEPCATAYRTLLERRGRRRHTVLDLDYRANFWASEQAAFEAVNPMLEHVTVAVGNRHECKVTVGTADPREAAKRLLDRGIELAIVKMGGDGVLVATATEMATVAPQRVEVVCGLGAGDAFGGALIHGLLNEWDPVRTVTYANAAGAIVAGRLLCADAMPTPAEIDEMLETRHAAQ